MDLIRTITNGKPQGIYAITDKQEVTDALLDIINEDKENEYNKDMLKTHLEIGLCHIPAGQKAFDWDENIHGKFFIKE